MLKFFKKKEKTPQNSKELLAQFEELKKSFEKVAKKLEDLENKNQFNIQKIGIVRFNPFQEMGGNQSFSIAILDGKDNGVVITSLYGKEGNRIYGKPIKEGGSEYLLSEEEKQAIEYAKRRKPKLNQFNSAGREKKDGKDGPGNKSADSSGVGSR